MSVTHRVNLDDRDLAVTVTATTGRGGPVARSITVEAISGRAITPRDLRRIPLRRVATEAIQANRDSQYMRDRFAAIERETAEIGRRNAERAEEGEQ